MIETEPTKPIRYTAFTHLNKRVTILGYPPVLGALFLVVAIMLVIFSVAFRSKAIGCFAVIYIPLFVWYTHKNLKAVKENRLELASLFFYETKRKIYIDTDNIINKITHRHE